MRALCRRCLSGSSRGRYVNMACLMNGRTTRWTLAGHVFLLLCLPLNAKAQQSVTAPLLSQTSGSPQTEVPLSRVSPPEALTTTGIVLAFHDWPDEEEKAVILRDTQKVGLQKAKEELQHTKVWFFTWKDQEPRNSIEAHGICQTFSGLSTLRYCRPMYLSRPRE